jgi:hypothetical protein
MEIMEEVFGKISDSIRVEEIQTKQSIIDFPIIHNQY